MKASNNAILIACLISTILLINLETMVIAVFILVAKLYVPSAPVMIIGAMYSIAINYLALKGITLPLIRNKAKTRWNKALMILLHALSVLILLISLLFLPMAFN